MLRDSRRRHAALVRADGSVTLGPAFGSIHKIGALAQGLPACNGWTFWHVERAGGLTVIDDMRTNIRAMMREAAE
jgi:modification methylase